MNSELINQLQQLGIKLGANGLPYKLPIHPVLGSFYSGSIYYRDYFRSCRNFFLPGKDQFLNF